ncbi:phosphate/phosphite/phosphonate ABC transporter substrate-binding protein [Roseobacter sinensis]|uniref:Phosphate/phosphite/phosphonate ABC transporter substrate-binding protein n=1 Tax=Roseobacter sinensis TaxID=2931391 RepID=A0ABT3BBC2_9RHOB|nr:phosphate/phosphite/phosphonate ABC transporter substrate-binding protein [Roseobacter sp. WL0113]MCV3270413.1 phosphate/phosphite/phosphonate ABC transporter substrate-binding protein [Roseobacter sp. WL0113]
MTASLPMYDTASTRAANDRLWALIRSAHGSGPEVLDRQTDPHDTWNNPDLLLSQTCGLPYRSGLHERVALVGTPDYGVEGCPPGFYRSVVVIRKTDPRDALAAFEGAVLARNDARSQSGWAAMEGHLSENGHRYSFLGRTLDTGSHAASAQAVAEGRADLAAIDAVTWRLLSRDTEVATDLRVLVSTRPTPGLPLISAKRDETARLFDAVDQAIKALSPPDRARLMLQGVVKIPASAYLAEPLPPR